MNPVGSFQAPSHVEAEYFSCTTRTLTSAQEKKCRQNHIQSASRLKKSIQSANTSQTCTEPSTVTHSSMENALAHDESHLHLVVDHEAPDSNLVRGIRREQEGLVRDPVR